MIFKGMCNDGKDYHPDRSYILFTERNLKKKNVVSFSCKLLKNVVSFLCNVLLRPDISVYDGV